MLHVTNGDAAGSLIERSGVDGTVVPWQDVLHEGPVPGGLTARELAEVRAAFLADLAAVERDAVQRGLVARDAALERALDGDELVLWFEHDLYDQLQLIQILDRLAGLPSGGARRSMICIGAHPAVERFMGLGQLGPDQLAALFPERKDLSQRQLELGRAAWRAFSGPDPRDVERLLESDTDALPYLASALRRHLAELPSTRDGLGRIDRMTLEALAGGEREASALFRDQIEREPDPFLGDSTYWTHLMALATCPRPLIRIEPGDDGDRPWSSRVCLLELGRRVAAGEADFVECNGIDRWWGGVHQRGHRVRWRWDEAAGRLRDCGT